jgi:hypothetical protein
VPQVPDFSLARRAPSVWAQVVSMRWGTPSSRFNLVKRHSTGLFFAELDHQVTKFAGFDEAATRILGNQR